MVDQNRERLKYITAVVIYGTIGMFLRFVNESISREIVALCRGAIGSTFILLYMKLRRQRLNTAAIRRNFKWLTLSGICLGFNWIFLFISYMRTSVAIASLCNYMAPMIVILISPIALKEPLNRRKLPCVFAAFVGIVLVSDFWSGDIGDLSGIFMGLAAAVFFVGIVICNRKLKDIPALDKSAYQLAISALTILPYAIINNRGAALQLDARSLLIILMLGLVHTGVAYCLYFSGMGSLPVQTVAILGYLEPVVSVLCSAIFLNEPLSPMGWVGAVLILGAAVISECIESPSITAQ